MQKIGNRLSIVLMLTTASFVYGANQAKLEILNMSNEPISGIEPSVPFKLVVTLPLTESSPDLTSQAEIEGLKNLTILERSPTMLQQDLLNRSGNLIFTYIIKTDTVGSYTLGPISYKNKTYEVTKLLQSTIRAKEKDRGFRGGSELEFKLERDTVYVGEPVPFSLIFRTDRKTERHHLALPGTTDELSGFTLDDHEASQKWARNGSYAQFTWQGHFFAHKSGKIMIPALPLQFISYTRFMFALAFPDTDSVYSSPAFLTVKPLPEPVQTIMAVGSFDSYDVEPDTTKISVGRGLVLKVSLQGRGKLDHVEHPPLTLPDSFRSFTSKTSMTQKRGVTTKQFYYVLQATKEGEYTIPAQRFDYFDPKDEMYKSLEAEPFTVTIEPGNPPASTIQPPDTPAQQPPDTGTPTKLKSSVRFIFKKQTFLGVFFWLLLLIAPLILLIRHWNQIRSWLRSLFIRPFSKRILILLKHRIAKLKDQRELYHAIKKGLTRYFSGSDKPFSDAELSQKLQALGIKDKNLNEWHIFINNLLEATQYARGDAPTIFDQLKEAAYRWLDIIEEHGEKYKAASKPKQKSYFCILFCAVSLFLSLGNALGQNTRVGSAQDQDNEHEKLLHEIARLRWDQQLLTQPYQDELEEKIIQHKKMHGYTTHYTLY